MPDFAAVFEPHVNGDGWQMTPRMALQLWHAALRMADEWDNFDVEEMVDDLPPVARPFAADDAWRRQFTDAFRCVAHRLGSADEQGEILLRRTAEEVALHLSIDLAKGDAIAGVEPPVQYQDLPDHEDRDSDFEWMREVLFEDHDVLMLYNPALDGIEIDFDSNDLLHPRDWFQPFR